VNPITHGWLSTRSANSGKPSRIASSAELENVSDIIFQIFPCLIAGKIHRHAARLAFTDNRSISMKYKTVLFLRKDIPVFMRMRIGSFPKSGVFPPVPAGFLHVQS